MYPKSTPDRLAASTREYSATRPGYGARTAGVIAQGFSTQDVTRLEMHLDPSAAGLGPAPSPVQRLVEVVGLDDPEPAEVLLRLGVRADYSASCSQTF